MIIAIVDDIDLNLKLMKSVLQFQGFSDIATFNNPQDALFHFSNFGPPEVLLTDFRMPEMTGLELIHQVQKISTRVVAVIISGDVTTLPPSTKQFIVLEKGSVNFFKRLSEILKQLNENGNNQSSIHCNTLLNNVLGQ